MACAYAKFSGELGVCIATSGPGASHLITGLYDARLDHMPVLAIAGQQARNAHRRPLPAGSRSRQHVQGRRRRLRAAGVDRPRRCAISSTARSASRSASGASPRSSCRTTCRTMTYENPPRKHGTVHSGVGFAQPRTVPFDADLRRAADVLNAGREGRDPRRRRRARGDRRSDRCRRQAARRRRQGAARQGRAAGRSALGHRLDRASRHEAELRR